MKWAAFASPATSPRAASTSASVWSWWSRRRDRGSRAIRFRGAVRLNDSDIDRGWTAEITLPRDGMMHLANGRSLPPTPGDEWQLFFGRIQRLEIGLREVLLHPAWVWLPHGRFDTHMPEVWTRVVFSADAQ